MEGVVVEVVLLVLPLVGDDGIELVEGHAVGEDLSVLVAGFAIAREVEVDGEVLEGGMLLHVEGVDDHHGRDGLGFFPIGGLAGEHGQETALHHGDVRFEDADPPSAGFLCIPRGIESKLVPCFGELGDLGIQEAGRPEVGHLEDRTSREGPECGSTGLG